MNWIHSAIRLPITVFLLGLTYYWFAVADRYAVFLYEHLGATPFDAVTGSRYWMAGLIANGFVLVLYTATMWLSVELPPPARSLTPHPTGDGFGCLRAAAGGGSFVDHHDAECANPADRISASNRC